MSLYVYVRDMENKELDTVDVYALIPEILDLGQIEHLYNLNANTIRKERWLQKQIKEQKLTAKKLEKIDTSGFGFKYDPVPMYRKLYYRRKDVEHFSKQKMQAYHSPKKSGLFLFCLIWFKLFFIWLFRKLGEYFEEKAAP